MPEELRLLHGDTALEAPVTEETSFNECFHCPYLQHGCSGPNLLVTSLDRVIEIFQISRARHGYSYDKLAELTGLSRNGIMRLLRGEIKDPSFHTIQDLARVLLGDPSGKHPCAMHLISNEIDAERKAAAAALEEAAQLRSKLATIEEAHARQVAAIQADHQKKVDFLKSQIDYKQGQMDKKDSQIAAKEQQMTERLAAADKRDRRKASALVIVSALLFLALAAIITALVYDKLNPDVGFFWRDYSAFYDFTRGAGATMPPNGLL